MSSSTLTGASAGSLILRNYSNFRGVDFSNCDVSLYRSPDSLNMWKDYKNLGKCIQTRPDLEVLAADYLKKSYHRLDISTGKWIKDCHAKRWHGADAWQLVCKI